MLANWKKRVFPLNRRQAVFAMLLCLVLAVNAVPALRASALYLITDGEATTAVELAEPPLSCSFCCGSIRYLVENGRFLPQNVVIDTHGLTNGGE